MGVLTSAGSSENECREERNEADDEVGELHFCNGYSKDCLLFRAGVEVWLGL